MISKKTNRIINKKNLTINTFVLQFERNEISFEPGQHLTISIPGLNDAREYSIYSAKNDPFIEILVKIVTGGNFSIKLNELKPGDYIETSGPYGFFILDKSILQHEYLFISTGVGIAPFHSIIKSNKYLNYKLLHGIRNESEQYEYKEYPQSRYISCTSKEKNGNFYGRVTTYLINKANKMPAHTICYLCGNSRMIEEASDILETKHSIPPQNIKTEIFF